MKEYKGRCDWCGKRSILTKELLDTIYHKDIYVKVCNDCFHKILNRIMDRYCK